MTDENIKRVTLKEARVRRDAGKTRTDAHAPEVDLPDDFWDKAELVTPETRPKVPLKLRIDPDVVEWFRGQGSGYQTRMNAVLRSYYEAKRAKEKEPA